MHSRGETHRKCASPVHALRPYMRFARTCAYCLLGRIFFLYFRDAIPPPLHPLSVLLRLILPHMLATTMIAPNPGALPNVALTSQARLALTFIKMVHFVLATTLGLLGAGKGRGETHLVFIWVRNIKKESKDSRLNYE